MIIIGRGEGSALTASSRIGSFGHVVVRRAHLQQPMNPACTCSPSICRHALADGHVLPERVCCAPLLLSVGITLLYQNNAIGRCVSSAPSPPRPYSTAQPPRDQANRRRYLLVFPPRKDRPVAVTSIHLASILPDYFRPSTTRGHCPYSTSALPSHNHLQLWLSCFTTHVIRS